MELRPLHRARRFSGAVFGRGASAVEREWAQSWLSPAEQKLFGQMSSSDQRHAIDVARRTEAALADEPDALSGVDLGVAMAAALLHDVGKVAAGPRHLRQGRRDAVGGGRRA